MSTESSFITIDTSALQETIGQICAGHDRLEQFLRDLFGNLDDLADEMVRHGRSLAATRQDQSEECSRRQEQLSREQAELDSTFARIQELTDRLGEPAAGGDSGSSEQLHDVLLGLEQERTSLREALESSQTQSSELARVAGELAERLGDSPSTGSAIPEEFHEVLSSLKEEQGSLHAAMEASQAQGGELARMAEDLAAARQDLSTAGEELRAQREILAQVPLQAAAGADPELLARMGEIEDERVAWAQERAILETELDTVRSRAAELTDSLDDERHRASGERNDWAEELRQMRRTLESLSERPVAAAADAVAVVVAPEVAEEEPTEDAPDPVLDSVMAQFEILQKDLARRRKAKPAR